MSHIFQASRIFFIFFSVCYLTTLKAQYEPIKLSNPSFEGPPGAAVLPPGWMDCGFPGETPPDTHPGTIEPYFNVTQRPQHGNSFMGLVTRSNDTWESASTRLERSLEPGTCYSFNLYLSRSTEYFSPISTGGLAFFTTPVIFRIWGGTTVCGKKELLGSTSVITHTRWVRYQFTFEPKSRVDYLILEAYYQTPVLFPYNGNVLVDNASVIRPIPCTTVTLEEEEEPEAPPIVEKKPDRPRQQEVTSTPSKDSKPAPLPQKEVTLGGIKREHLKTGQVIGMDKVYFKTDSYDITPPSFPTLDGLFNFLYTYRDIAIEVGGHTNSNCDHSYCDQLSESRAKAVVDYLIRKGIEANRLSYKGYGKRKPIASNETLDGRRRNQRVEITVVDLGVK